MLDCAASVQCTCDQPLQGANVSARETPASGQGVHFFAPIWPQLPVAAHLNLPPQGPPLDPLVALAGRHTYLTTLRLRI